MILLRITCILCFILAGTSGIPAQVIDFKFALPDGLSFSERLTYTQIAAPGTAKESTTTTEAKTRYEVKKTAEGYEIKVTPVIMASFRDGERAPHPLSVLMRQAELTYKLDPEGRIREVLGIDAFIEKLKAETPAANWQTLSAFLNKQALETREISEWNGRIGNFIGRKAIVGEGWGSIEEFPLPTGERLKFYTGTKVEERFQRGPRVAVKLLFSYTTEADEMTRFLGKAFDAPAREAAQVSEIAVEGGGERILDPSTLMIFSETVGREVKMKIRMPGRAEPVETSLYERKEYIYEYD